MVLNTPSGIVDLETGKTSKGDPTRLLHETNRRWAIHPNRPNFGTAA